MSRGVLYLAWPSNDDADGAEQDNFQQLIARSIASLKEVHPELPYEFVELPKGSTLLDKSAMADLTPFDETLFLDADTVVLDRLDYAFDKAAIHGLAAVICECPWARRYGGLKDRGDMLEYNTGALWFTRKARPVFDKWRELTSMDSSMLTHTNAGLIRMPLNDQGPFAEAIEQTGFNPWVLPLNWNYRPRWHTYCYGPVKIYHDPSTPAPAFLKWNRNQCKSGEIVQYIKLEWVPKPLE